MPFDFATFQAAMSSISAAKKTAVGAVIVGLSLLGAAGVESYSSLETAGINRSVKIEQIQSSKAVQLAKLKSEKEQAICHDALLLAGDETPNKLLLSTDSDANHQVAKLLSHCSLDNAE